VLNADALTSVGNSLVGAVIGSGKFSRGQEGAPLLSYEYTDHDQSAVRIFSLTATLCKSRILTGTKVVHDKDMITTDYLYFYHSSE